jgi:cystathionine gamma-synthase
VVSVNPEWSPRTRAVAEGRPSGNGAPLNQPIVLASNFRGGGDYGRTHGTDGWRALESAVGSIEGGSAVSFASGMAAANAVLFALAPKVVVIPTASYLGVRALLTGMADRSAMTLRQVDVTDTRAVLEASEGADLVWLESPTNPTLDEADLGALCATLRQRQVATVVDSTFATPMGANPLSVGATATC